MTANGRYRHIFIPSKFFICSDFLAESLMIRKLLGSTLTFSKISARKKVPENSKWPFYVKNGQLHHFLDVRKSLERQASKKFYKKCSENSRSQIVFRTDIFRKLTLGAPEYTRKRVARAKLLFYLVKLLLFLLSRCRFILRPGSDAAPLMCRT